MTEKLKVKKGDKYGRLTIIKELPKPKDWPVGKQYCRRFLCICECGNKTSAALQNLRSEKVKSCGCYRNEVQIGNRNAERHGKMREPLYKVWVRIKSWCYNTNSKEYEIFGKRGIKVCKEWRHHPEIFIEWAKNKGWRKGISIELIDTDKNFSPKNCRFVSTDRNTTIHGYSKHPLYEVWGGIIQRCYNKNIKEYKHYGGRGIKVCKNWKHDRIAFIEWALGNGWQSGLEIDRIDNNKGYGPKNCRFVTHKVNCNNTRRNLFVSIRNKKGKIANITFSEAFETYAHPTVSYMLAYDRYCKGNWSIREALTVPKGKQGIKYYG